MSSQSSEGEEVNFKLSQPQPMDPEDDGEDDEGEVNFAPSQDIPRVSEKENGGESENEGEDFMQVPRTVNEDDSDSESSVDFMPEVQSSSSDWIVSLNLRNLIEKAVSEKNLSASVDDIMTVVNKVYNGPPSKDYVFLEVKAQEMMKIDWVELLTDLNIMNVKNLVLAFMKKHHQFKYFYIGLSKNFDEILARHIPRFGNDMVMEKLLENLTPPESHFLKHTAILTGKVHDSKMKIKKIVNVTTGFEKNLKSIKRMIENMPHCVYMIASNRRYRPAQPTHGLVKNRNINKNKGGYHIYKTHGHFKTLKNASLNIALQNSKVFKCNQCNKTFREPRMREEHIARIHVGKKLQLRCKKCGTTSNILEMMQHVKIHLEE
jgi:hypothetical protein